MPVGIEGRDVRRHDVVEVSEPVEVDVEDPDVRPEAGGDLGGVGPDDPASQDRDLGRRDAGTPASKIPRPSWGRSRYLAPSWMLIRPATSLIGVSSGRSPRASRRVS